MARVRYVKLTHNTRLNERPTIFVVPRSRAVGGSENPGVTVLFDGQNPPKSGGTIAPPAPPGSKIISFRVNAKYAAETVQIATTGINSSQEVIVSRFFRNSYSVSSEVGSFFVEFSSVLGEFNSFLVEFGSVLVEFSSDLVAMVLFFENCNFFCLKLLEVVF